MKSLGFTEKSNTCPRSHSAMTDQDSNTEICVYIIPKPIFLTTRYPHPLPAIFSTHTHIEPGTSSPPAHPSQHGRCEGSHIRSSSMGVPVWDVGSLGGTTISHSAVFYSLSGIISLCWGWTQLQELGITHSTPISVQAGAAHMKLSSSHPRRD